MSDSIRSCLGLLMLTLAGSAAPADYPDAEVERLTSTDGAMNGNPDVAPDGRIGFVSNRSGGWQVWVMAADGSDPRQLTEGPGELGFASWSRDGRSLYFHRQVAGRWRLFVVEVATATVTPIPEPPGDDFHRLRPSVAGGDGLLYDRRQAGADPRRFAVTLQSQRGGDERVLVAADAYNSDARLAADGRHIVFHSGVGEDLYSLHYQVHRIASDGSGRTPLTSGERSGKYPKWSPDGRWIVYSSESRSDGRDRDVWLMAADGSAQRRLTGHPGLDFDASWTPDGRSLVFVSDRYGGRELVRMALPDRGSGAGPEATDSGQ